MKQSYTANKIKLAKDQSYVRLYFKKLRKTDRYVGYPDLPRAHYDTFVEIFEHNLPDKNKICDAGFQPKGWNPIGKYFSDTITGR